jgi:hypothetical protein
LATTGSSTAAIDSADRTFADEARILHVALNLSEGERRWGQQL